MNFNIITYFIIINIAGILINILDKYKAKHNKYRIPERVLWLVAFIGGATGSYVTMQLIRHKTQKKKFMIIMPLFMIIQIILLIYCFFIV